MSKISSTLLLICCYTMTTNAQLINFGDNWNYYDNEQAPANDGQGNAWIDIGFDDGAWSSGNAQLGYGDNDEATVINGDTYTGYFRKAFTVSDISMYDMLEMDLIFDDGAVVYLNGTEIWRVNMPTGSISYTTFASSTSEEDELATAMFGNLLINGINVIAVEVHQRSASSSDLSFDFRLSGIEPLSGLPDFGSTWKYYDLQQQPPADAQGDAWIENDFNDQSWQGGNAQLGYGDDDENTLINENTYTAYFRKTFQIDDASIYSDLNFELLYDDGAIVYLNGIEIWRVNMPSGNVDYNTFASSSSGDNQLISTTITNNLINGLNTIAVEIHQRSASSSDLSFDLKVTGSISQEGLPNYGAVWKYYDNQQKPDAQNGITWTDMNYNDSAWSSGAGQLGYGDGDENTTLNDQTLTAYFRHTFSIADPSIYNALEANLIYDDGAVIYLNGVEIMRQNMPEGTPAYNTFALQSSGDNAFASETIVNSLIAGDNTIAVEIHQRSTSSSDISFDFSLVGKDGSIVNIVRGPYLQKGSESQVTVKWKTDLPSKGKILYGTAPDNLVDSIEESVLVIDHEVTIGNLQPATKYYYAIKDSLGVQKAAADDLYFKTHPAPMSETSLTAWILGDCGTGNNNARAVRDAYYNYIGEQHTDLMLFLGDNAYNDGTENQYQNAIFENMYEEKLQNTIAWSCLGNHDGYTASSGSQTGPYYDIFTFPTAGECGGVPSGTEAYYSFNYGDVHFIILDSYDSDRSVGGSMYNWCLADIQNTTAKWIVALWHHPPYTKGSHDSDSESSLIQMRERFLPILEDNGVDLVLSGHSHSYERSYYLHGHYGYSITFDAAAHTVGDNGADDGKINGDGAYKRAINGAGQGEGTVYITTGSAGKTSGGSLNHPAMYYSVSSLGSCVMEVSTDTMHVKFLRETGIIEDHFTITKCKGLEVVQNGQDTGEGSMRQMIADACALDTITFDLDVTAPIALQSEILLDKDLFFRGHNTIFSMLSGGTTNRIFNIVEGTVVDIENITFIDGFSSNAGGAILNAGTLRLRNVNFENNKEGTNLKALTNTGELIIKGNGNVVIQK